MDLRLQKPAFWASLHLRRGLHDWDLAGELSLGATCDQGPQVESTMQPHLWTWVNPSLVCPIPGPVLFPPAGQEAPPAAHLLCLQEEPLCSSLASQAEERGGEAPQPVLADLPQAEDAQRVQMPASRKAKTLRSRGRKLKRIQGGWARPPLNYCILISLALSSSADGSLTVQEIYQFTREAPRMPPCSFVFLAGSTSPSSAPLRRAGRTPSGTTCASAAALRRPPTLSAWKGTASPACGSSPPKGGGSSRRRRKC
uniref:Forkhead box protein R1 isoform X2 n=1 Tax=Pogona vitticeps TaxID=103695 RepID=A0ABM5EQR4_9SAUR